MKNQAPCPLGGDSEATSVLHLWDQSAWKTKTHNPDMLMRLALWVYPHFPLSCILSFTLINLAHSCLMFVLPLNFFSWHETRTWSPRSSGSGSSFGLPLFVELSGVKSVTLRFFHFQIFFHTDQIKSISNTKLTNPLETFSLFIFITQEKTLSILN